MRTPLRNWSDLFCRTQYGAQPEFEPTLHRPQNRRSDKHTPDAVTNHRGSVRLAFRWESGRRLKRRASGILLGWYASAPGDRQRVKSESL
jgi:hypothetical protein